VAMRIHTLEARAEAAQVSCIGIPVPCSEGSGTVLIRQEDRTERLAQQSGSPICAPRSGTPTQLRTKATARRPFVRVACGDCEARLQTAVVITREQTGGESE